MVNFIDGFDVFHFRINDARTVLKKRRKIPARDITIFIDGGGQNRPMMLFVPAGIICPPAEKGNSKRCAANDHRSSFMFLVRMPVWLKDFGYHDRIDCLSRIFLFNLICVDFKVSSTAICPNFVLNNSKNLGLV